MDDSLSREEKKVGLPGGPRYRNPRANQLTGSHSNPIAPSAARFFHVDTFFHLAILRQTFARSKGKMERRGQAVVEHNYRLDFE